MWWRLCAHVLTPESGSPTPSVWHLWQFSKLEVIVPQATVKHKSILSSRTLGWNSLFFLGNLRSFLQIVTPTSYRDNSSTCDFWVCSITICCWTLPEFVGGKDNPALQHQRGKNPKEETQTQWGEETFKVYMFKTGVWRSTQLDDL